MTETATKSAVVNAVLDGVGKPSVSGAEFKEIVARIPDDAAVHYVEHRNPVIGGEGVSVVRCYHVWWKVQ